MSTLTLASNINGSILGVAYNDMYLTPEGNIAISYDQQALLEQCAQAAKTLLGECIFNINVGIPYQQSLWIGVPNIQQFSAALRRTFLSITGIVEVLSLNIIQHDASDVNTITYGAVITTIYGTGAING